MRKRKGKRMRKRNGKRKGKSDVFIPFTVLWAR